MTQAELLNYILEKEKIKKEDLAKLFGIRKKNAEKVLNGELSLTKRQIKNISQFTQIPEETIKSGGVTLPDIQNTGVVFIDEEFLKNQNTEKFKNFIKNRFKIQFISLFLLKLFIYFILIFLSIFAGCAFYSAFIENIDKSTVFSAFFTLIPYLLGFASIVPMFKVIKKVNFNEVKRVKLYYFFIIIANLISLISLVALNANNWAFFGMGLFFTLIPLGFLILENNRKINEKQIKILSTALIFVSFLALQIVLEHIKYLETDRELYFAIVFIGLNLTLIVAHICYWVIKDFAKFSNKFQMLNNKKCLKKKKVLRSLVSVLLVTAIVAGGVHFGKLLTIKLSIENAFDTVSNNYKFKQYSEYNKHHIEFTDKDETITVEMDTFTYKIPANLIDKTNKQNQKEDNKSSTYKNEEETIMVTAIYRPMECPYPSAFDFDASKLYSNETEEEGFFDSSRQIFFSKFGKIMKDTLVEKYGFYPQNDYDYRKLGGILNLEDINYWDKQEVHTVAFLTVYYAVFNPVYDESSFYETGEITGFVDVSKPEKEETGKAMYSYMFSFNKCDAEWLDCRVMINLPEEVASTDLAYKIINSVEMK